MPGFTIRQSLKNVGGFTFIEMLIAVALITLITGAIVSLFAAGIKSSTYAMRQIAVLANSRRAMNAGDPFPGMVWQSRQAMSSTGLSNSQLALATSDGMTPQYNLNGQTLEITRSSQILALAKNITSVQYAYYNLSSAGLIMVSTSAANATLVTTWMQSQQANQKTYTFYSAARLRNHQ